MSNEPSELYPRPPDPNSALWIHFGDLRSGLYGPHALLLQVMHPVIDAGVRDHSRFKTEPFSRLFETARSMATLVYGGGDGARAEARRLRALHKPIRGVDADGNRYHSLDPEAWAWVYATLVKGSIDSQLRYGFAIPRRRIDAFYWQARELGLMMGVRPQDLPEDWDGFEAYFERTVETRLRCTQSAKDVLQFLGNLPRPFFVPSFLWKTITWPIARVIRLVTIGTLPQVIRDRLELAWTDRQEDLFLWFVAAMKIVSAITPRFFFYFPTRVLGLVNGELVYRREQKAARSSPRAGSLRSGDSGPSSAEPP